MRRSKLLLAMGVALLSAASGLLMAADAPASRPKTVPPKVDREKLNEDSSSFLRLKRDKNHMPLALQTAIVRYAAPGGADSPTVDLIAAVHIADAAYYKRLNREFAEYDAVLYELVAPENAATPKRSDSPSNHPISLLQNGLKDVLALEFQLKGIDYTVKNMVHADMSPERFSQTMDERGESLWGMCVRMMGYAMTQQRNGNGSLDGRQLLDLMFDKNRTLSMKRMVAEQFVVSDATTAALEGPSGSTLISGRNRVAIDVLRKELAAGKKKIAVFYGAAHMFDLQKRLHEEFNMSPVTTRWLTAWNMADSKETGRLGDGETGRREDKRRVANP
jgi:hypothetical protein